MSKVEALVASTLLIILAGCSSDPQPPAATDPPAASTPAGPGTASGTPSAAPSTAVDAEACLQGRFRLLRFVGKGASDTYGTGTGGDVEVRFDEGRYVLTGAGREPVTLAIQGQSGELLVDGRARGTYKIKGDAATFTVGDTSGRSTLKAGGKSRRLTMEEIANVLAPEGTAELECNVSAAAIVTKSVRLEFERI